MASFLKGTAFITGAASGIGKASAFAVAKHGIERLSITDVSQKSLAETTKALQDQFPKLEILSRQLNVCDEAAVNESILETTKRFGRLDFSVNVAGIGASGKPTAEEEFPSWEKVIDVNLHGIWRCQRAQIRAMLKQEDLGPRTGRGVILNISSMYGLIAPPSSLHCTPYVSSKHGVLGLTKADAVNYARQGIRINALCPGYVKTPLLMESEKLGYMEDAIKQTPMGRMAETEEIGDVVVFLGSRMSSFVVGSGVVADGGYSCG